MWMLFRLNKQTACKNEFQIGKIDVLSSIFSVLMQAPGFVSAQFLGQGTQTRPRQATDSIVLPPTELNALPQIYLKWLEPL